MELVKWHNCVVDLISYMNYLCNIDKYSVDKSKMRAERCTTYRQV